VSLTERDYRDFLEAARSQASRTLPGAEVEATGSLASGELVPGLSDLDILVEVPIGRGPATRDSIPLLARQLGDVLTVFVDPFSAIGTICSVYPGPLKVDWFVREGRPPSHKWIWRGASPPPYDSDAHPWDWVWWLWGKLRRGDCELARSELSKLWQWLTRSGVPPNAFPPELPSANQARLEELVVATLPHLPTSPLDLADEVSQAIRSAA
jgi:predicted nucleotidyltransferase